MRAEREDDAADDPKDRATRPVDEETEDRRRDCGQDVDDAVDGSCVARTHPVLHLEKHPETYMGAMCKWHSDILNTSARNAKNSILMVDTSARKF